MQLTEMQHTILSNMVDRPPRSARMIAESIPANYETVVSVLKLLMANGLAFKSSKDVRAWKYALSADAAESLKEQIKPHSLNGRTRAVKELLAIRPAFTTHIAPTTIEAQLVRDSYVPPPWESVRAGADDHRRYKSKS